MTNTFDRSTGEVVETAKFYAIKVNSDEQFYMTYIGFVKNVFELNSLTDIKILVRMCCMANFNTGVVDVPSRVRKEWCEEFKTGNSNISNTIKRLKELKLIDGEGGRYTINPQVFWRGDRDTRTKMMKTNDFKVAFVIDGK